MRDPVTGLTDKQLRFVDEYVFDRNGKAAYERAGYKARGQAAEASACRLLRNVKVRRLVEQRLEEQSQQLLEDAKVSAQWVITRLKLEATSEGKGSTHTARVTALGLLAKIAGMMPEQLKLVLTRQLEQAIQELVNKHPELADDILGVADRLRVQ